MIHNDIVLSVENLYKKIPNREHFIFQSFTLELQKSEIVVIQGPSGCGKTTLARILIGLTSYDAGNIYYWGKPLHYWLKNKLQFFRERVQYIFQQPKMAFPDYRPIGEIFYDVWRSHFVSTYNEFKRYLTSILKEIGLELEIVKRYTHQLSGGQIQRLAIARSLLLKPDFLICDEITSQLDEKSAEQVYDLLTYLNMEKNMTLLLISHQAVNFPSIRYIYLPHSESNE